MTLVLRYSARSDRGLVRQNNQDSVYAGPRLLALADGMGGHAAGEVASSLVISALAPLDEDTPAADLLGQLREAAVQGNAAITQHVADAPDLEGMGTTLTAVLFAGTRLGLVHVGDSRAYQLRDGTMSQITKDDTFVQSLIDEGRISEDEAHNHPQRSLLLRAITGGDIEPSLTIREARAGDRYLLCSDGLSGVVSDDTLADTLKTYSDPRACADRMIELALRGGGPDNITCIVADVVDVEFGEDVPIIGGAAGDGREEVRPDSSAARASATTMPHRIEPQPRPAAAVATRKKPSRLRVALAVAAVLAVLVGATIVADLWVDEQYFVAAHQDRVAIYQGVLGEAPMIGPLHTVAEQTDIELSSLPESARTQVSQGIPVRGGLPAAKAMVARLRDQVLPPCQPPPVPAPAPVPPAPGGVVPVPPAEPPLPMPTPEPGTTCRPVS
jgi:protein phosphatase